MLFCIELAIRMKHFPKSVDKNIVDVSKQTTANANAVRDFRTRLNSIGTGIEAYEQELLESFAKHQINSRLVMPVVTAIIAIVSAPWIGWLFSAIWLICTIASYASIVILAQKLLNDDARKDNLNKWRNYFFVSQILMSLVWAGYVAIPCVNCGDNQYAIIQFSAVLVLHAFTFMVTYAFRHSALMIVAPATLLLVSKFMLTYEASFVLMGAILIAAIVFFYMIAGRFKQSVLTMLQHTTTKEILIVELETEKSISETARSRAEEANLAKSRFLATMSHELRTPLNAILGFSEIMRDEVMGPVGNENYKEYVADIHNSGAHLLKLINEILDISRIEAGKHELNEEKLKLMNIVDEACHMISIKAKQKNIELITKFEEDMPTVWVDERAIRQITLNLVSNALKFTPTGGSVTIKVGWTAKGGQYISVKDTGPGIPEDEIPIVLSSFGQGTIAINNAEQGTGLGLTIVQALLQMHQGNFQLKSKLREGTEAIAFLPHVRVSKIKQALQSSDEIHEPETESEAA